MNNLLHKLLKHKNKGEKVIFTLRRHWITLVITLLTYIILALVPIGVYILISVGSPGIFDNPTIFSISLLITSSFYLYLFLFLYSEFVDYYLDIWIVTTERIINVEQKGLFFRVISEQKLYRIQDVKAVSQGIIQTFFNYGNVFIQTAAEEENFNFKQIPDVFKVSQKINDMIESDKMKKMVGTST